MPAHQKTRRFSRDEPAQIRHQPGRAGSGPAAQGRGRTGAARIARLMIYARDQDGRRALSAPRSRVEHRCLGERIEDRRARCHRMRGRAETMTR